MKNAVKKVVMLLLCAVLLISMFTGCGNSKTPANQTSAPSNPSNPSNEPAPPPADEEYVSESRRIQLP